MDQLFDVVRSQDPKFWLLVALCVALVYTIQAVEGAVNGFWPHQRRAARVAPGGRLVLGAWSWVGFLLLPGLLLGILNVLVVLWRNLPWSQTQLLGGVFAGLAWLIFVLVSADVFGLRRVLSQMGPVGPAAMLALLVVGDVLLLIAVLNILPGLDVIRDALPDPNIPGVGNN